MSLDARGPIESIGTWAFVSLAKPPVVSDSGNNIQPGQNPRPQLSSNHDGWRPQGEEGVFARWDH